MDTDRTISTFLDFYRDRGHHLLPGSSLVPSDPRDPVLFTTSGMHPLTPHLEGRPHPLGRRLVNRQRCLRTTDLEEVGDRTHLTVFQMLGTWSLGDYDHGQSIRWGFELLRDGFGLDPGRMHVTVFGGDRDVGPDLTSERLWGELGLPTERTGLDNWWSNRSVGPCGPDTELFVWTGSGHPSGRPTTDDRWVEVWNHVSMRYRRHPDGQLSPLERPNVDTGMGLERLVTTLQGVESVHEIDVFEPWRRTVGRLWELDVRSQRLVCDHLRSSYVVLGDGVRPGSTGRGYVLRRLLRRTLTTLWSDDPSRTLGDLPDELLHHTGQHFGIPLGPEVRTVIGEEEQRFRSLLRRGRPVVERLVRERGGRLSDSDLHRLRDTHGLPRELVSLLVPGTGREGT